MGRFGPKESPFLGSLSLGLVHAAAFGLAFPPFGLWPLAFVALIPLLVIVARTERPARSAVAVGLATLPMWLFHERWLIDVTPAGFPALGVYLSLYPALFVWIGARVRRLRWFEARPAAVMAAAPIIWVGLEFFRGTVFMHGYPWFLLAHPTIDLPYWAETASFVGAYGVSALTAAVGAAALAFAIAPRARRRLAVGAGVGALAVAGAGFIHWAGVEAARSDTYPFRIAVVQTDVPQDNKIFWSFPQRIEDFRRFAELTREAAGSSPPPDLIVWPETMFPGFSLNEDAVRVERKAGLVQRAGEQPYRSTVFHDELLQLQKEVGVPMLVGAIAREGMRIGPDAEGFVQIEQDSQYNSAFVIADGAVLERRYDKVHLTPFGEEMPYISQSKWLESRLLDLGARGMRFDLSAGTRAAPLEVPVTVRINSADAGNNRPLIVATPICFEATVPGLLRRLVSGEGGPAGEVIINLTNDGWFGRWSGGREQHLQTARWRAIELGRPVIRAANTGISCQIDAHGKVIRRGPDGRNKAVDSDGVMMATIRVGRGGPRAESTLYSFIGDVAGWACMAATAVLLAATFVPALRKASSSAASSAKET